ncbi:adenosine receptor A3 isoform X2 [Macaca nemestrina]|uniref:adenosine receptor A3 isoform X2 n=1 Tax=Macaca nemestrina TaxID=9545 RepID=UPI0039B94EDC
MMSPDLSMGLVDQYWDDSEQNGHEDAQNQGPDVQALSGGGIGLGPSQVANHLPVPGLHGVGECYEAQAAGVHEEGVEQGPDNMVRQGGLAVDVDHGGRRGSRVVGRPQHSHLVLFLEHLIAGGLAAADRREDGLERAVHGVLRRPAVVRFRIPGLPGCILSFQLKVCFLPVMWLFILLSLALFSDAMVMDEKVKESFVLDTASAICNYNARYKDHPKYWCRGYFRDYCNIIAFSPNSTNHVALRDTGNQLIVTMSCLTKEDTGWYWCGIQRDFARDDMDFTELIVTDNKGTLANDFWSGKDLSGNKTRSCKAPKVVGETDHSRTSILIICILITGLGIISIISHLTKRRRSQRNRRGNSLKPFSRVLTPKEMAPTEQM